MTVSYDRARVLGILAETMGPYVGDGMARTAGPFYCTRLGIEGSTLTDEQLDRLLAEVGVGLKVFLGQDQATAIMNEVRQAITAGGEP